MKIRIFLLLLCLLFALSAFACNKETPPADESQEVTENKIIEFEVLAESSAKTQTVMLPPQDLRIISMNLSCEYRDIDKRAEKMIPLLLSYEPDSIGTQENSGNGPWEPILEEGLPNYDKVGICGDGNESSSTINSNFIYYNTDKYTCLDWYTFWPSYTTTQIASCHSPTYPRTCTWAIFENKETGFKYAHINCHLAFEIEAENIFQISIIRDLMKAFADLGIPTFTTGDFNTSEGSFSYGLMTEPDSIDDPKYLAKDTMNVGSFRGWDDRDLTGRKPIDFCFVTGNMMDVHQYEVIDTYRDGVALTDHCGIFVNVTVDSIADPIESPLLLSTEGISLTELSCTSYHYDFSFTQADDIFNIHEYHVELLDSDGNLLDERNILTKHLDEVVDPTKRCTFTALEPDSAYTVKLYVESLIGTRSDPIVFQFKTLPLDNTNS